MKINAMYASSAFRSSTRDDAIDVVKFMLKNPIVDPEVTPVLVLVAIENAEPWTKYVVLEVQWSAFGPRDDEDIDAEVNAAIEAWKTRGGGADPVVIETVVFVNE